MTSRPTGSNQHPLLSKDCVDACLITRCPCTVEKCKKSLVLNLALFPLRRLAGRQKWPENGHPSRRNLPFDAQMFLDRAHLGANLVDLFGDALQIRVVFFQDCETLLDLLQFLAYRSEFEGDDAGQVFGAQETAPGGRIIRTIGLVRAKVKISLVNLAPSETLCP